MLRIDSSIMLIFRTLFYIMIFDVYRKAYLFDNNLYNAFHNQLYDICCRVVQKHHYFLHMLAAKEENGFALRKWYLHMTFNFPHYLRPIFVCVADK